MRRYEFEFGTKQEKCFAIIISIFELENSDNFKFIAFPCKSDFWLFSEGLWFNFRTT